MPARGGLQVEADILGALDDGTLLGRDARCVPTEPLPPDSPFWTHPKVTLTPHNAADTDPRRDLGLCAGADRPRSSAAMPLENVVDRKPSATRAASRW